jgi:hypothetical protein
LKNVFTKQVLEIKLEVVRTQNFDERKKTIFVKTQKCTKSKNVFIFIVQ